MAQMFGLIHVEWGTQDSDGEMCQKRSVVVELNPSDHAMVLQILPHFGFADLKVLGQFGL